MSEAMNRCVATHPAGLATELKAAARRIGFDLVGIAPAVPPAGFSRLEEWLDRGFAGEMQYLQRRRAAYEHPRSVLQTVRSVVMLGWNYNAPQPEDVHSRCGRVARYAQGAGDYHDLLRARLETLAEFLHERVPGCRTRGVVDTAPLLERDFARLAGLGWFGKNTMLIHKRQGSWLFLAALLTDVVLPPDAPHDTAHCGTCTRCLDACPTHAFPEPYVLDATRCIAYLTIELRDQPVPELLRPQVGDWLFGCDICQEVCPWNRKAPLTAESMLQPQADLAPADARAWLALTDEQFEARFRGTALDRPGRAGLLRNACIVLGNTRDVDALIPLTGALRDAEPLIRGAAAWALGQIGGLAARQALLDRDAIETDDTVRCELAAALRHASSGDG